MSDFAIRDSSGLYTWKSAKYPSVTTLLSQLAAPELMMWYATMAAEDCAKWVELWQNGNISEDDMVQAIMDVNTRKTAAIRFRDYRGNVGSLTHHAIYEWSLGVRFKWSESVEYMSNIARQLGIGKNPDDPEFIRQLATDSVPYVRSAFRWLDHVKPDFEAIGHEAVVISETYGYAGTMDALARINGQLYTLDWKTSKTIDKFKFRIQCEAYRRADFIGLVKDGSRHELPRSERIGILHIEPTIDMPKLIEFDPSDEHFDIILSLRDLWAIKQSAKRIPKPLKSDTPFTLTEVSA